MHVARLRFVIWSLSFREQFGNGSTRSLRANVIERQFGVETPAKYGKRKQEDENARRQNSWADAAAIFFVVIQLLNPISG